MARFHSHDDICNGCLLKLEEADPVLKYWFVTFVKPRYPNVHISWAFRDKANQTQAFADGKSCLRWPLSPHNRLVARDASLPFDKAVEGDNTIRLSAALDLFEIGDDDKGVWNKATMAKIAKDILKDKSGIVWAGNWKSKAGQSLGDFDHFQLNV